MKKTVVLHIIHWPKSGIVNLVYNQILASTASSIKYKVGFFILDKETRIKFEGLGIDVVNYNYHPMLFLVTLMSMMMDIKKTKPQIVHTHSFLPGLFARVICIYTKSFKMISTIHNSYPYIKGKKLRDRIKVYLEIQSINRVNSRIICVSKYVKEYLCKYTNINPNLIDVVYLGILINDDGINLSDSSESGNRVIIVGRLDKQKRHDRLLNIWSKVVEKIPAAKLDIVGDGSERDNLERMVNELQLSNSVNLFGFREDVPKLIRGACFSVLTSSYEGLPVVIAESFMQKRPVIAFDIDSLKEIIDEKCGILVKPFDISEFADKVIYLLNSPKESQRLGENGYKKILAKFNLDTMVNKIERLYFEILNLA